MAEVFSFPKPLARHRHIQGTFTNPEKIWIFPFPLGIFSVPFGFFFFVPFGHFPLPCWINGWDDL